MKTFEYNNRIIVHCPVCHKTIINDNLELGEDNGIHACKHLLFIHHELTGFIYAKNKNYKNVKVTPRLIKDLNGDKHREIYRVYDNPDNYWYFLFDTSN